MQHEYRNRVTDDTETRLLQYIERRNKRTGQTWRVVKRYCTINTKTGFGARGSYGWERAIIENEHGKRIRMFDYWPNWRMS